MSYFDGMKKNIVKEKSKLFALEVIKAYELLTSDRQEYVMSKQLLRSGTAIGALVREAEHAESKADFIHKMNIALKEANETLYWIELLVESNYLSADGGAELRSDAEELVKILASIVKSTKQNLKR